MSSRVQKGGQRFKPTVAKARPRQVEPSSRQLSSVPESQAVNSTPIPDEVVQAPSVLSDAAEAMNQQRRSGAGSEAARPIDDTLNQAPSVTRAASTEGSTSAENVPQKRSAPTAIAVGRSRATPIVTPAQRNSAAIVLPKSQPASLTEFRTAPVVMHEPTPAPAPVATTALTPAPAAASTAGPSSLSADAPVNPEHMEALLSILQSFSNPNNDDPSLADALYLPNPPTVQRGGCQTAIDQNANAQPPSVGSDPYGTLSLELENQSAQHLDSHNANAQAGNAGAPLPKKARRSRAKKSKENVAGPSEGEGDKVGEASTRKRRRSKSKSATQEQSNNEDSQEPNKRPRRSGRRKASRQVSTAETQSHVASENDSDDEAAEPSSKRKGRKPSTRKRRPRAPSLPPIDPDADPGEDLDPTAVTMAAICNDTGQGRVSSKAVVIQKNFSTWKQQNREKRARMHAIMEAKKYGRKDDEVENGDPSETIDIDANEGAGPSTAASAEVVEEANPDASDTENQDEYGNGFDYSQSMSTSAFNVQVRIGANGETIIDEESLFVDRGRNAEAETEEYTHVEESDQTKFVNSMSYTKKARGSRWSKEETELFYDALQQFGENYELISLVLPGRDRKSCKNKFKAEDKKNTGRVTECLKNRTPYDIQTLSRLTGKDFSGPTPEIRIPEIPRMGSPDEETRSVAPTERGTPGPSAKPSRKRSRTPRVAEDGVEVVGDVDSFVDMDDGENGT